ncbi:TIGR01548 family HAD-type hydrolase [Rubrivirga litoralis]|uniref:phosphoglycolate phosphatase n=1 Tax=Rubrivirga litoralis TaxID=3075598 RepID=A0ABU3BQZ1_9BACT|nr:TIGR01548 family HAD-type hydrolase [Rubrivirga sp. F394]MDT0631710.1 TIGR01548 family HAD-type hydrolase [Rubrivirga sp. F394]
MKAVLLDMDGVLVDVRGSFRRAVAETVGRFTGTEPTPEAIQAKKDQGGFNNDWILSHTLVQEAGGAASFDEIKEAFNALYRGRDFDGLIATEPPLVETATLEALAERYALALVTGRPEEDAEWTLRRFGWDALVPLVVGMGQQAGREKPDPYGLALALDALGAAPPEAVYAGDTVDDQRAAVAAGCRAVGVVPPGLDVGAHGRTLMAAGAEVVLSTPNDLPALLATWDAR